MSSHNYDIVIKKNDVSPVDDYYASCVSIENIHRRLLDKSKSYKKCMRKKNIKVENNHGNLNTLILNIADCIKSGK